MSLNSQIYSENGVAISKEKIFVGDKVTLTYDGLLAKSGADTVIAHIGYGELWEDKTFIPMDLVDGNFKVTIKITQLNDLNVSFKDSAENWDNNSGINYSFKVSEKSKTVKKENVSKPIEKTTEKTGTKKVADKIQKVAKKIIKK